MTSTTETIHHSVTYYVIVVVLAFILVGSVIMLARSLRPEIITKKKAKLIPDEPVEKTPSEKSLEMFDKQNNGLVKVRLEAIQAGPEISRESIRGYLIPPEVEILIFPLPDINLYDITRRHVGNYEVGTARELDRRRGLTIGSALFNYPIHESFVFIDDATRKMLACQLYMYEERRTFNDWGKRQYDLVQKQYNAMLAREATLGVTEQMALNFYKQHEERLVPFVLGLSDMEYLPPVSAMVYGIVEKLKLAHTELTQHLVWVAMTLVVCNAQIEIPIGWLVFSPTLDYLFRTVNDIKEEKPASPLKLVVNNVNKIEDKNVW